jgi:hypothetical protein
MIFSVLYYDYGNSSVWNRAEQYFGSGFQLGSTDPYKSITTSSVLLHIYSIDVLSVWKRARAILLPYVFISGSCWVCKKAVFRIRMRIWIRSGSRRAKMTHKSRKIFEISCCEGLDVVFLRAEGFLFCSLEILVNCSF